MEVVTPVGGRMGRVRREWPDDYKAEMAARSLMPDVNASALAREIGISPAQLFGWRKFARDRGLLHDLESAPLAVPSSIDLDDAIDIELLGVTIRCRSGVNEVALSRVIRAVRQA